MEMTLTMTDINDIKELQFKKDVNVAEIMRKTNHDRKTINKYFDMTDYEVRHLNLSFPQSNTGYVQLFKGENLQCLEQGMKSKSLRQLLLQRKNRVTLHYLAISVKSYLSFSVKSILSSTVFLYVQFDEGSQLKSWSYSIKLRH